MLFLMLLLHKWGKEKKKKEWIRKQFALGILLIFILFLVVVVGVL